MHLGAYPQEFRFHEDFIFSLWSSSPIICRFQNLVQHRVLDILINNYELNTTISIFWLSRAPLSFYQNYIRLPRNL